MSDDRGRSAPPARRRERPEYTIYRTRPKLLQRLGREPQLSGPGTLRGHSGRRRGPRVSGARVARYLIAATLAWLALSLVVFLISAQIQEAKTPSAAERALNRGGVMPVAADTILVLGSDARPRGTHEGGANVVGQPSRADTILLMRAGGGSSARLSIPRDTVVDIPGHGPDKVNAAYAIGGPALAITTIQQYLGIDVNHIIEVNFDSFPQFIDSLGGVYVTTGRVCAKLDGGDANGGTTIDLRAGKNHLDGRKALALARIRKNSCKPSEDDRTRAARQQQILRGIKRRMVSPATLLRLPWVSWAAPKAIRTDMSGPTLLGLFAAVEASGSPPPRVLEGGFTTLPNGSSAIAVPEDERRSAVRRFLGR